MPTDRCDRLKPPPKPADYEVGYGKPPRASRFAPGQSGNPEGRRKGARNKPVGTDGLRDIILAEAYRSIKVKEGKRQTAVPMATAVMRTLAVNAARGQARSQRLFSKLLSEAEQARALQNRRLLEKAVDYKFYWGRELERRKSLGIADPDPFPHPDDVRIDPRTGEITIVGPRTKEEKVELDFWYDRVEELDHEIELESARLKKIRSKTSRARVEDMIKDDQARREAIVSKIGEPSKRRRR
jgi:Family of unknown function (DUF5681)